MAYRTLEINLISAKNLKDVNFISKMDVYAVVSVFGDLSQTPNKKQKIKTPIAKDGGSNPVWNFPMKFTIEESLAQQNRLTIVFKLKSERAFGDKEIGEVNVPVKELLDSTSSSSAAAGDGDKSMKFVSYQVKKPSGKPKGMIEFSYKFSEKFDVKIPKNDAVPMKTGYGEPVTAYPVAAGSSSGVPYGGGPYPPQGGYGYPQQQQQPGYGGYPPGQPGYGYPPQVQPGYGYPPQAQPGYGYPPPPMMQQAVKPKKNRMGGGLGLGLGAGLLGGLLIGDMVSDAADYGDMGGGFDGGFDF